MEALVVVVVVVVVCAVCVAYRLGAYDVKVELRKVAQKAYSDVDEDGRKGTRSCNGADVLEGIFKFPAYDTRASSRETARDILVKQGAEGARVAQEVLDAWRKTSASAVVKLAGWEVKGATVTVPDGKPMGDVS